MAPDSALSQKLQEAERKYRLLAENLVDAIWVVDAETRQYVYISPSVEDLRGFTAEEVKGRTIEDFLAPDSLEVVRAALVEEIANFQRGVRRKRRLEVLMRHKDGRLLWVEVIARLFMQDGRLRIIGVTRDVDQRKKLELERDELVADLSRALSEEKRLRRENLVLCGLLPICAKCKSIRGSDGQWHNLELYIESHSEATFTHTICPSCKKALYPELGESE